MTKTYAIILMLTLGAPLAATEMPAPQLPLIDAAVVRGQIADKETVNKSAMDQTVAMPLWRAKIAANTLRTVALSLRGLQQLNSPDAPPLAYTEGVEEVSEAVNEGLMDIDTAIKMSDSFSVHHQIVLMARPVARLAKLARSIESDSNYSYWAGPQVQEIAVLLERNMNELRLNVPFSF